MKTVVNDRIKEMRKKRQYTQAQLAELLGLKCSTYSQMERKGSISVEMAKRIAEILDVDSDYIIYGENGEQKLDFSPIPQKVLTVSDRRTFLEQIRNGEEQLILSVKEKNIIKNFRALSEEDKKEFLDFLKKKSK